MSERPLIGISTRSECETRRFYLGKDYSEAVIAFGGTPVLVPLHDDEEYIIDLGGRIDGLLLPGSDTDPDPEYFGEEPHPRLKKVVPEKDRTDLLLLKQAEERNIPVLGICFGMQILNVSRGGSLIQDIGSQIEGCLKHEQGIPLERASHYIEIESGSSLAKVAGPSSRIRVNSHHHQSVKQAGENLSVVARSSDGVVEAIEDSREDRWMLGVQWHPELSWAGDAVSRGIFETFIVNAVRDLKSLH